MSNTDNRFVIAPALEQYYVDKDTGLPLAAGIITFYEDDNRSVLKPVYEYSSISGYTALPNPCILSAVGTFQDGSGNNIIPYYFPFQGTPSVGGSNGTPELYYIKVQNSGSVLQFTREAWPPPSQGGSVPSSATDIINFIPNGQFLAHNTTFPSSSTVTQSSSIIAQGGWTFETNNPPTGTYTITWDTFTTMSSGLPDYPRYAVIVTCSNRGSDTSQNLRIRFPNVNKFSLPSAPANYTLFFNAQTKDGGTYNVDVDITRYYGTGGSPSPETSNLAATVQIKPGWNPFSVTLNFGTDAATTVGTNNDDFIALDFHVEGNGSFTIEYTDFALVLGNPGLASFPAMTDAQMLSQGVTGWMPTPDPLGSDLYLPLILTQQGMIWDDSGIGKIYGSTVPASNNELLCDGSSYFVGGHSSLGIPYSRLFNKLFDPIANFYVFGSGSSFIQSYINSGLTSQIYITTNQPGAVTHPAVGVGLGSFTFRSGDNGAATVNYTAYANANNFVTVVSNFTNGTNGGALFADNNTTMTFTSVNTPLGGEYYKVIIETVTASTLANGSSTGKYFTFSNHGTNYNFWFKTASETTPGGNAIQCDIDSNMSAADVAVAIETRLNEAQIDFITCSSGAGIAGGDYFTFFANSASPQKYVVWYKVDNVGSQPVVGGSPVYLLVSVGSGDSAATIADKTQNSLNTYQFAVPDLRGMFLRGNDPTGLWDLDVAKRYSFLGSILGTNVGTFELDQLISHDHTVANITNIIGPGGTSAIYTTGPAGTLTSPVTNFTGGTENRPVNMSVNWVIKY